MDGWPKVQLVATPDVGAAVRYNFNTTNKAFAGHDGFDSGAPGWGGRPGQLGGTDDYRTIRFTHYVDGSDTAAVTAMATLGKLLTASSGYLLIQLKASVEPRWAKVWRSTPGVLSWDRIMLDDGDVKGKYAIDITLTADPFLYGASTQVGSGTVTNNASGSIALTLTDAVGDAIAPAIVKVTPGAATDGALHLVHTTPVLAAGTAAAVVWDVGTGDGFTVTNFGAAVADADWTDGEYRQSTATPAILKSIKTVQPGRYLAVVRAGAPAGATGVWTFGLSSGLLGTIVTSDPYLVVAGSADEAQWHVIGEVSFPQGATLPAATLATEAGASTTAGLRCDRVSGTGNINVDSIVLLPTSEDTRVLRWVVFAGVGDNALTDDFVDGEQEIIYSRIAGVLKSRVPIARGGYPTLKPGANVLHFLGALAGASADGTAISTATPNRVDTITTVNTIVVTYRPRWLWPAS